MKSLKIFSLGAIAVAIAMALIGASSASATALCSMNQETCASPFAKGTAIEAHLKTGTTAKLETSAGTVECSASETKGETTSGPAEVVTGVIKALNFTGCKTTAGLNCTVGEALNLPYNGSVEATGGGNGTLTVAKGTGGGNPGATVSCLEVIECTFRTPSAQLTVTGGNPATAVANKIILSEHSVGKICPAGEAKWSATYEVVKPNPLFISVFP